MIKNKIKNLKKWQKQFVMLGNQYSYIDKNGNIVEEQKWYWYQSKFVFNIIKPFVDKLLSLGVDSKLIWGEGKIVDILIPYQIEYNELKNQLIDARKRLLYPTLIVEDGSVDVDELSEEGLAPGKVLVYRQGSSCPTVHNTIECGHIDMLVRMCKDAEVSFYNLTQDIEDSLISDKKI